MVFLSGGGEATNPQNMEALNESVWSWGIEEEDRTPFPYWKGVEGYREPVYLN